MEIGAKRVDYHAAERKRILCTVSQSGPFIDGERGRSSVDLGHTKGALILSREPNKSTEKHVQKETSLSRTAIEPPQWTPQIKPWRESKARMWEMCLEVCAEESAEKQGRRKEGGLKRDPSSAIGPVSATALKESQPSSPNLPPALHGNSPHYRGMSIHTGHLHYSWARENGAAFNSKLVTW